MIEEEPTRLGRPALDQPPLRLVPQQLRHVLILSLDEVACCLLDPAQMRRGFSILSHFYWNRLIDLTIKRECEWRGDFICRNVLAGLNEVYAEFLGWSKQELIKQRAGLQW
jgi:hypothetical protein